MSQHGNDDSLDTHGNKDDEQLNTDSSPYAKFPISETSSSTISLLRGNRVRHSSRGASDYVHTSFHEVQNVSMKQQHGDVDTDDISGKSISDKKGTTSKYPQYEDSKRGAENLIKHATLQLHGKTEEERDNDSCKEKFNQQIEKAKSRLLIENTNKARRRTPVSQRETASFITNQIQQRICSKYAIKPNGIGDGKDSCECGRPKIWHEERKMDVSDTDDQVWHPDTHTEKEPCDSFGEIFFTGFGTDVEKSLYARVDFTTPMSDVWELMIKYWKMPQPCLLISVTGEAEKLELKPRLSTLLKQGLVEAAVNTGAWIISGGTASGVMEFVGEAVRDHTTKSGAASPVPCVALGIATWGCVANSLALDGEGEQGLWPATYAFEDIAHVPQEMSRLDPNHTHFLLVDIGQEGQSGMELNFRSDLEYYISAVGTTGVAQGQTIPTPVVLLIIGGDIDVIDVVYKASKRNTSVVVICGSGGAADIFALAFKITSLPENPDCSQFLPDFEDIMQEIAMKIFASKCQDSAENESFHICLQKIRFVLKRRSLLNIFNLDDCECVKDLDQAILSALLKANKLDCNSQLALALAWDRCDIARQHIFTPENRIQWKLKDLYDAMFTALVQDRADFVELFLDSGVDLRKFLTIKTLWNLYCNLAESCTKSKVYASATWE
ncbi:transient receptor potential cation channel subfamily m member 2 [Plakobranchus ocellatus]|uniref:Transient receptor potential cation channel subfamily m member 2 n=1 Tax=Plakobranchus ocellatus TaxID=259542 RepID=A0AAV4CIS2_9GAST|nr:transient receptor potential cation channel subfamily m member 2 [Plakobranchus ocellatus]